MHVTEYIEWKKPTVGLYVLNMPERAEVEKDAPYRRETETIIRETETIRQYKSRFVCHLKLVINRVPHHNATHKHFILDTCRPT